MELIPVTKLKNNSEHGGSYGCIPLCTNSTSKGVKLYKVSFEKKKVWSIDKRLVQSVSIGTEISKKQYFLSV